MTYHYSLPTGSVLDALYFDLVLQSPVRGK
jgi:hypothetical protein